MRRLLSLLALAQLLALPAIQSPAQDNATRAGAIADRDAAEERYKRLNSAIEDLVSVRAEQERRLSAMTEEVRSLRAEVGKNDSTRYATRDELRSLAEKLQEIENKRLADRKLIDEKFAELKSDLRKMLNTPAPSTTRKKSPNPAEAGGDKPGTEKPGPENSGVEKPAGKAPDGAPAAQEGAWYSVESGNTLAAIVAAHNEEYKKQGKKTSLKLVLDANPGLKPTSMKIGQKIFIPVVAQ
jgi:Skp family chaperone for outer membrane proteins